MDESLRIKRSDGLQTDLQINQQQNQQDRDSFIQQNTQIQGLTKNDLQDEMKQQKKQLKDEEENNITEYENLLSVFDEDLEDSLFDSENENLEIDKKNSLDYLKGEIIQKNQTDQTDFLKGEIEWGEKKEIEKEIEKEGVNRNAEFFKDDLDGVYEEKDLLKEMQTVPVEAKRASMKDLKERLRLEINLGPESTEKNEKLFQLCEVLNRLTELDEQRTQEVKFSGAGFEKGGIANEYLSQYADKKFIRFLEYRRIMNLQKLALLYRKLENEPVPKPFLKSDGDDPRDPALMRQYAAFRIRHTESYRELRGINRITDALQKNMPENFADRIGINNAGNYLTNQRKDLTKQLGEDDAALVSEGEGILNKILQNSVDLLNQDMIAEDLDSELYEIRDDLRKLCNDQSKDYLEFPVPRQRPAERLTGLALGEVWPPLQEGETFEPELSKREELTSRLAKLLGMGDVVKSVTVGYKNEDNGLVTGYLVKNREGQKVTDALSGGKKLSRDAKSQIAEIVMLNLISGNEMKTDGDLIVEGTKAGNENVITRVRKNEGLQTAFTEKSGDQILKVYGGGGEFGLLSLGNLSEGARQRILNLTPAMLTEMFAEDLTGKEISALQSRLSAVKKLILSFEKNKVSEKTFAAKKVRKYLNAEKQKTEEEKLARLSSMLPEEMAGDSFRQTGALEGALAQIGQGLSQEEKERFEQALKGREASLYGHLMNRVDRYLALSDSVDFKAKLRANDPAAVSVKRDYEQQILDARNAYQERMREILKRLEKCETRERALTIMTEFSALNERDSYFAMVQNSRYKNNEDSDSMMLLKESVRVLSDRTMDRTISGAQGLEQKLKSLNEQYQIALDSCKDYITSHKPRIGFWHEDGRKRYEMVQALEKRLLRERARVEKNGKRLMEKLMTGAITETRMAELLAMSELETVKSSLAQERKERTGETEREKLLNRRTAFEGENLISLKKVREAVTKIRDFAKVEFLDRLKISDSAEIFDYKNENDQVFQEVEEAFEMIRNYQLLGGSLLKLDMRRAITEGSIGEFRTIYSLFKDLKKTMEDYRQAAKELALHPMRFTAEGEALMGLSVEELEERESKESGEIQTYISLMLKARKCQAKLNLTRTFAGVGQLMEANRKELKDKDKEKGGLRSALLLRDLLSDTPDPALEKQRVEELLKKLYREKQPGKTPPNYVVAHLYGKEKQEITDFVDRITSGDTAVRKEALKEIVERSAADPSVILQNVSNKPVEMLVNAEYNFGLALRAAALEDAFKEYKKVSSEVQKELSDEAELKIAVAKELGLDRYEVRYSAMRNELLKEVPEKKDYYNYINELNTNTELRKSMGLLTGMKKHKLSELARKTLGENASPKVMLRFYHQLMMRSQRNAAFLLTENTPELASKQSAEDDNDVYKKYELSMEQEKEAYRKYEERKKLKEKLPEVQETYFSAFDEKQKVHAYDETIFREKWEQFKKRKVTALKMKSVSDILLNVKHNMALFREAQEMQQLLSLAILNGASISDQELKEADIKFKVFAIADEYTRLAFKLTREDTFLYLDADHYLSMPEEQLKRAKGSLSLNEDMALTKFFTNSLEVMSKLKLPLGENGIKMLEGNVRKKEEDLRKKAEERIKIAYEAGYGKKISQDELKKRRRNFEKNKALWSAASVFHEEITKRQGAWNELAAKYNRENHTQIDSEDRVFQAYMPMLTRKEQTAAVKKLAKGGEEKLSVYMDMINYLVNADYSILQETSTEGMLKSLPKAHFLAGLTNEVQNLWDGFVKQLKSIAEKMKEEGRSKEEIDSYIQQNLPSDEVMKKLYAVKEKGMDVAARWLNFRDNLLCEKKDEKDMEKMYGILSIEDLDQVDHIAIAKKEAKKKFDKLEKEMQFVLRNANMFSKNVVPKDDEFVIEMDRKALAEKLVEDMREAESKAPLDKLKQNASV